MWHNRDLNQRKCWCPGCQKWQLEVDIFTLSVLWLDKFVQRDKQRHSDNISLSETKVFHQARHQVSSCLIHDVSNGQIWNLGYWNVWVKMTCWTIIRQNFQEVQHVLPVCLVWHEKSLAKCYLWTEWSHITKNKPGLNWNVTLNPG